ncbi:LysR family transcriptional regulator [Psychromonas aquimarina]|uniref:LysR family transcriptional regulator n=1 Tax=Psychromonas aquimarina TaxID=444919 RepID=UPI000408826F|nr:LysR family transcriptional regulator [Psychromonas aquimarina]
MEKEINLADIKAFVLIAQQGSFTKAADILGCSRSHLSKQLNQLETQLGVKLIARTTRSQRLTDLGKQFFDSCLLSLQGINQAVAATVDNAQKLQGNININSVGGIIGEEIICSMINDFLKQYPDISVNLDFSSQRVDLIEDEFDLVFRMGELQDSGLIARKLMDIPIDTLASPAYLQKSGYPEHPKALQEHQCITGSINHWHFHHINDPQLQVEAAIKGAFRCKSGRAMLNSAKAGNGIVRLPRLYCSSEIDKKQLVPVFSDWEIPSTPFFLLYQQDKYQPARLRVFINFVVDNFAAYTGRTEC